MKDLYIYAARYQGLGDRLFLVFAYSKDGAKKLLSEYMKDTFFSVAEIGLANETMHGAGPRIIAG